MIKRTIVASLAIAMMVGCQNKDNITPADQAPEGTVSFSSSAITSRVTQMVDDNCKMIDAWQSGDKVGISTVGLPTDYFNVGYKATTKSTSPATRFAAIDNDNQIIYPKNFEGEVTFVAYYPYNEHISVDTDELTFDFSEATGEEQYFLVATTTKQITNDDAITDIGFTFAHAFSKLQINLSFGDEIGDISKVSAELQNVSSAATYNLKGEIVTLSDPEKGVIVMEAEVNEENRTAVASTYLHAGSLTDNSRIILNIAGDIYNIDYTKEIEPGKLYSIDLEL